MPALVFRRSLTFFRREISFGLGPAAVALALLAPCASPAQSDHILSYARPADRWMLEALPLGNGAMGAMVFGRTDVERLQFNHDTLWTGSE